VKALIEGDGDLDWGLMAPILLDLGYGPWTAKGRYRACKHPENPNVLNLREWPEGRIIGKQARKLRRHLAQTVRRKEGTES